MRSTLFLSLISLAFLTACSGSDDLEDGVMEEVATQEESETKIWTMTVATSQTDGGEGLDESAVTTQTASEKAIRDVAILLWRHQVKLPDAGHHEG